MVFKTGVLGFLVICSFLLKAQNCDLELSGYIRDKGTDIPLPYSNVFIQEAGRGVVSDSLGYFEIEDLCPGSYHLTVSHIGCESVTQFVTISRDTQLTVLLIHHSELLDEVVVHGSREENSAQISSAVSRKEIERSSHKNLSDILESISGVSTLKTGSGISKPVVHGLYGNRVTILNNGIVQSGQQWGNDHAPEIDPFIADHLSVIKGAGALAYGGNSLGSVVMVEVSKIKEDPHLHGNIQYHFQSNGLGNTLNAQLEKKSRWAAWRLSGTLKLQGDAKAPDYYLTNTGNREGNLAVQLEKKLGEKWHNSLYYSMFNTEIGVLQGSHISNLTDLEQAIGRDVPFFTNDHFSYQIEAPRQTVSHHLLKAESKYFFASKRVLKLKYGGQLNDRREFDIRRGGRSGIPALSLKQYSHFLELAYDHTLPGNALIKTGMQYQYIDNTNDPETGILPLIPDYEAHTSSGFIIFQKENRRLFYELGARYDLKNLNAVTISRTLPRVIERFSHLFHNYSFSSGFKYEVTPGLKLSLNAGYMLRAPEVNELYSFGLHQGVSGIEEGNRELNQEKSLKIVTSLDLHLKEKLFVQALGYYQRIRDYIYLQPQNEFRLTIRGAFPVFVYSQTHARIYGTDLLTSYQITPQMKWIAKYALVRGRDVSNDIPLINMPPDNVFSSLTYSLKDGSKLKETSFSITGKYVFRQSRAPEEQDFLPAPDGYFLLGFKASTKFLLGHSSLQLSLAVENALNETYRDYLNRQRYFADEVGRSVNLGVNWSF